MIKISVILLNDIEDQLVKLFTGNDIISLTCDFADSVGEQVTFHAVDFNSKKEILSRNISDLSDGAKIKFFSEIKKIRKVSKNQELVRQIDQLISDATSSSTNARIAVSELMESYSPKLKQVWTDALKSYDNDDFRNALDSIRLALELLLKQVLNNNKSLENQKNDLGRYLQKRGISSQFRNLLIRVLEMYEKIQNDHAKHDLPTQLGREEISFLMNQGTLLIRFIDNCEKKGETNEK